MVNIAVIILTVNTLPVLLYISDVYKRQLLVGVLPFLCYIIFSNRYTNQIMLERETSLTESALQQAVQSVENKLETYNNLSNYMFNNTSILQALNTEYSKDYFRCV